MWGTLADARDGVTAVVFASANDLSLVSLLYGSRVLAGHAVRHPQLGVTAHTMLHAGSINASSPTPTLLRHPAAALCRSFARDFPYEPLQTVAGDASMMRPATNQSARPACATAAFTANDDVVHRQLLREAERHLQRQ